MPPNGAGVDKFVVFVSGLSIGGGSANPLHFQLFVDHITGHLGDEKVQYHLLYFAHLLCHCEMMIYLVFHKSTLCLCNRNKTLQLKLFKLSSLGIRLSILVGCLMVR